MTGASHDGVPLVSSTESTSGNAQKFRMIVIVIVQFLDDRSPGRLDTKVQLAAQREQFAGQQIPNLLERADRLKWWIARIPTTTNSFGA